MHGIRTSRWRGDARRLRALARAAVAAALGGVGCVFPSEQAENDLRVRIDSVVVLQVFRGPQVLQALDGVLDSLGGEASVIDTQTVAVRWAFPFVEERDTLPNAAWLPRGFPLAPRLSDRLVVHASIGSIEGSGVGEFVLVPAEEATPRGPAANGIRADTIDLLSAGSFEVSVQSAGFSAATPATLRIAVAPSVLFVQAGDGDSGDGLDVGSDTLFIGSVVPLLGDPSTRLRDPVSGKPLALMPDPVVRVFGERAFTAGWDTAGEVLYARVPIAAPAESGETWLQVEMLGLPALCAAGCATSPLFLPWDGLEPARRGASDTVGTSLDTLDETTPIDHPLLILEDVEQVPDLGPGEVAVDWYTFEVPASIVAQIEVTSDGAVRWLLADALVWDAQAREHAVDEGGQALGTTVACAGVALEVPFGLAALAGKSSAVVALRPGTYHLLVSAPAPLVTAQGYAVRIAAAGAAQGDGGGQDDFCDAATLRPVPGRPDLSVADWTATLDTATLDESRDVDWRRIEAPWPFKLAMTAGHGGGGGQLQGLEVLQQVGGDSVVVAAPLDDSDFCDGWYAPGSYLVAAHAPPEGYVGTYTVAVTQRPSCVTGSVVIIPGAVLLHASGDTVRLDAEARDPGGVVVPGASVTWSSLDPGVADVSPAGLVSAVDTGTARIVATAIGAADTATITVQPWASLTGGVNHTCGLTTAGQAWCWGGNAFGQLGDGTGTDRWTPTAVAGGLAFASLAAGDVANPNELIARGHTCGLTLAGWAYCWGDNNRGQVGDGTTTGRWTPTAVAGELTFASLTLGGAYGGNTCGLTPAGQAWCWGGNGLGQLGDSTTTDRSAPTAVHGGLTFASLADEGGGDHTCGLTPAGQAYCWGFNHNGQLGDSTTTSRVTPTAVADTLTLVYLTRGRAHTCGLTPEGHAWCWGSNSDGQLGDGTGTDRWTPTAVAVAGGLTFASLAGGGSLVGSTGYTCGLTPAGQAYCWGDNGYGQLGDGTTTDRWTPTAVEGGLTFVSLTAGGEHTCGLTTAGEAYCWGWNRDGQLGDGTKTNRLTPVKVR